MATATLSPPPTAPHEEEDNDNQQPPTPQESVQSPPSPIEDVVDQHQQFAYLNSPYSPRTSVGEPEKPVDREHPPPEDVGDEQEPEKPAVPASPPPQDKNFEIQQCSAPPSPSSKQPPSPPTGAEDPVESPNYREDVDQHQQFADSNSPYSPRTSVGEPEKPVDREHPPPEDVEDEQEPLVPASPPPQDKILEIQQCSAPPSPSTGAEDPVESPNYRETLNTNPTSNPDHESPSPSSPTTLQSNPSPKAHESPKDISPSPPPTAASPSSPPLGVPLLHAVASSSPTKPQTSPWTHQETANLIQAYQEKWYSLKKGPLKASQWEEVAITVAARCGYDEPTKTAKQCRHKIEKLRKRYRTERGKPRSKATAWNFFKLMDNLEKGPLPISSSQPIELVEYQKPSNSYGKKRKTDDGDGDGDSEFLVTKRSRSKSSNHRISNGDLTRDLRFSVGGPRGLRTPVVHKHKGIYQEEEDDSNERDEDDEEEGVAAQLAEEIKGFAENFVKLENKKIEMIKDVERYRLEMENKRMEMILESQQMLVQSVNKAFSSSHKTQKRSAN